MLPPESEKHAGVPETSAWAFRNLTAQVRQLEMVLLAQSSELQQCRERAEVFETAAAERLTVIERGDQLLHSQRETIAELQRQLNELRTEMDAARNELFRFQAQQSEEQRRLETAKLEALRGTEELAYRERVLTRENLELRNEGLLHSIIRRIRSIGS